MSSFKSVKLFAEFFIACGLPLHILVCNAGVYEPSFVMTEDKLEKHFAVNYLGHYYLTMLLTEVLIKSEPSRVVMVTSESHWLVNKMVYVKFEFLQWLRYIHAHVPHPVYIYVCI